MPHSNASMAALDDIRTSLLGSPRTTTFSGSSVDEKSNRSGTTRKYSQASKTSMKKVNPEPAIKRARVVTPFKVRKEKLGDRITALHELVSPFGKTDTASVLHEAIEYIKCLHDQVNVLSAPYMKSGSPYPYQQPHQQQPFTGKSVKATEGQRETNLRSRGLCLVPMSTTFTIASQRPHLISSLDWKAHNDRGRGCNRGCLN